MIEVKNPNNEITVTYLLYELERQFRLRERLHHMQPVIMVARDIPRPDQIDEAWLLRHAWILDRVLLDQSFAEAIDYLSDGFVGNAIDNRLREAAFEDAREHLRKSEFTLADLVKQRDELRQLKSLTAVEILKEEMGEEAYEQWKNDLGYEASFNVFGGFLPEKIRVASTQRYASAMRRKELAEQRLKEIEEEGLVDKAQGALTAAQRAHADAVTQWSDSAKQDQTKVLAISRLRMHVKDNILYYMHAIWDHEVPDQRFFELSDIEITTYQPQGAITIQTQAPNDALSPWERLHQFVSRSLGQNRREVELRLPPPDPTKPVTPTPKLRDIADLNKPLGYFGNYAVFPLTTCTYITDYMMSQYIDSTFGLRDPDPFGQFTNSDLQRLLTELDNGTVALDNQNEIEELQRLIQHRLQQPVADFETVTIPTGQLYMEALPGTRSLLEPFKLAHRELDVIAAQERLAHQQLDSARRALRLTAREPRPG